MIDKQSMFGAIQGWSLDEQIQFVQDVWDRIARSGQAPEPSDEMQEELDRRLSAAERNPNDVVDWKSIEDYARRKP